MIRPQELKEKIRECLSDFTDRAMNVKEDHEEMVEALAKLFIYELQEAYEDGDDWDLDEEFDHSEEDDE